ncbi:MAG: hypothetical protein F6J90_06720 [Moorea sp. SIOASIH]|uniref:hypothetical protein n=1 Tax=Moorena sp. SIOASIH TaxID=2607817 RepID=UPI0013BDE3C7|nr:hypothetical protein [Moorena sp. SIOASIH]NEO36031.1 hypothetical protein [Moorena sp. SIOASIH]NEO92872.1 hypothetical protein [Moorena sp. SIO3G5]
MVSQQNSHFNVDVSQVVGTSTAPPTTDITPSGLPILVIQGGAAVAGVIVVTVYSTKILGGITKLIEAITKLVKEAKED